MGQPGTALPSPAALTTKEFIVLGSCLLLDGSGKPLSSSTGQSHNTIHGNQSDDRITETALPARSQGLLSVFEVVVHRNRPHSATSATAAAAAVPSTSTAADATASPPPSTSSTVTAAAPGEPGIRYELLLHGVVPISGVPLCMAACRPSLQHTAAALTSHQSSPPVLQPTYIPVTASASASDVWAAATSPPQQTGQWPGTATRSGADGTPRVSEHVAPELPCLQPYLLVGSQEGIHVFQVGGWL
jgi:hypothetical protein